MSFQSNRNRFLDPRLLIAVTILLFSMQAFAQSSMNGVSASSRIQQSGPISGDVNCDAIANAVDALFILQHVVGLRTDTGSCPLASGSMTLNASTGDINNDATVSGVDALFILQCDIGMENLFCPPAPQGPHNVMLLIADDMGVEMLSRYGEGGDYPPTPNIDTLFDEGVFFRNAWAAPICSPTRATMLTGRYGFRTGIGSIVGGTNSAPSLSTAEFTIPEALKTDTESGYASASIGKWHLGLRSERDLPNQSGYDHYAGVLSGGLGDYYAWTKTVNGQNEQVNNYATSENVDDAIEWLDQQNSNATPWFLWMAFNAPHSPFHAPPSDLHSIDLSSAPDDYTYYKAAIQALDTEIGRLLDSLPADVRDNTTIIFIGDNGTPGEVIQPPYSSAEAKGRLYEGGINVPLVIAGPRVHSPGRESTALVQSVDIFATVLELMGIDVESAVPAAVPIDSVSMVPQIENSGGALLRNWIYTERFAPGGNRNDGKTIRDDRFKLIRFDNGTEELYDLDADHFEEQNLLASTLNGDAERHYCELSRTMNELLQSESNTTVPSLPAFCDNLQQPEPTPTPAPNNSGGIDLTNLPIGDGRITTSTPQQGYIYVCSDEFRGGAPSADGDWLHADGTFDYTAKLIVDGAATWDSQLNISQISQERQLTGNGLPSHQTGTFPISPNDDAYQYDRNPNPIQAQELTMSLPQNPQIAATPSCLRLGAIGIGLTGAVYYNGLDAWGKDAVAHEIQDACQGHPQAAGVYHYHNLTGCLVDDHNNGHSELLGYARDGFGLYGHHNSDGSTVTNADLDECHGHVHEVAWDGEVREMYHYHATHEYPYTLGCYKGTPVYQ